MKADDGRVNHYRFHTATGQTHEYTRENDAKHLDFYYGDFHALRESPLIFCSIRSRLSLGLRGAARAPSCAA